MVRDGTYKKIFNGQTITPRTTFSFFYHQALESRCVGGKVKVKIHPKIKVTHSFTAPCFNKLEDAENSLKSKFLTSVIEKKSYYFKHLNISYRPI